MHSRRLAQPSAPSPPHVCERTNRCVNPNNPAEWVPHTGWAWDKRPGGWLGWGKGYNGTGYQMPRVVPGAINKTLAFVGMRLSPRWVVQAVARKLMARRPPPARPTAKE